MDDNKRPRAEFPVGDGLSVIVTQPTDAQILVLALSRAPEATDTGGNVRLIRRLFSVMEALMGQDTWDSVIESGMISGKISAEDLLTMIRDVMEFEWKRPGDAIPPRGEEVQSEVTSPRPAPRLL